MFAILMALLLCVSTAQAQGGSGVAGESLPIEEQQTTKPDSSNDGGHQYPYLSR
jgi:hypothetical protein